MRIAPVWTLVLMFSAAGCESPGTSQRADDRAEVDQDPGEREPPVLSVPQVGSYPDLGQKLASIVESIESARAVLRQDSGTLAADAALIRTSRTACAISSGCRWTNKGDLCLR